MTHEIDRTSLREEVYKVIDGERKYQNSLKGNRTDGSPKTVGDYLVMMDYYLAHAKEAWTANPGIKMVLPDVRKLAAIAVRCMEEHGAPKR
jgi:hypothetical protein